MRDAVAGLRHSGCRVAAVCAAALTLCSCSHPLPEETDRSRVLVQVGDSILTYADVTARIPAGISAEDSTSLFSSIVEGWMQEALLREMATVSSVDMERIDRMTADYRNRLVINAYMAQMERGEASAPSEEEIRATYARHADELIAETPLVKGVYIKLPADARRLDDVRRWVRSSSRTALDNIEKHALRSATEYDRFTDRWVDWEELEAQIPHDFGDPDTFLKSNRDFETADASSVYLLHITDVLPAGSRMPYDFAAPRIGQAIRGRHRTAYGREIVARLAERARGEGRLKTPGYDLRNHKMTNNTKNTGK